MQKLPQTYTYKLTHTGKEWEVTYWSRLDESDAKTGIMIQPEPKRVLQFIMDQTENENIKVQITGFRF
jgi:hypothetical protein